MVADKAPGAFRTIGEMAQELGVKPHILRYWEEQFPALVPLKRAGGRRHYRAEDAALLHHIRGLVQDRGFTIKGARQQLDKGGAPSAAHAQTELSKETGPAIGGQAISQLRDIRARLARAIENA